MGCGIEPGPELFGRWLELTLTNRKCKQRVLAHRVGASESAVSRWVAGKTVPDAEKLQKMARLLEVNPLRLVVTAGIVSGDLVDAEPLPLPEPTVQREFIKGQLNKIKGLTPDLRQQMIQIVDEGM